MSKAGKFLFFFALLAFLLLMLFRMVIGGWENFMFVPLILFSVLFSVGVVNERKFLKIFFGARSTKHGLNMGVLVIVALAVLTVANYFAGRYNKTFDWTSERLNSLSPQSVQAAENLAADTELLYLYRKEVDPNLPPNDAAKAIPYIANLYENASPKIHYKSFDALTRPDLAMKLDFTVGQYAFFAVQGERKVKIDPPNEEGVTRALIKLSHDKKKTVYFTRGHGELLVDDKSPAGISIFADELGVTYEIKPLVLFESKNQVPDDAAVVAIVGPKQQFLDAELAGLRAYANRGGRFFIAIDPGTKHNLALLTKSFGVEFGNDFILDPRSRVREASPTLVLGTQYALQSFAGEVTKAMASMPASVTLYELASTLKIAPGLPETLKVEPMVTTNQETAATPVIKENTPYLPNGPHTLAMAAKGKFDPAATADFEAVIIGDSDFLGNRLIHNNLNRDLASNSIAWLASDSDLISIRPKQAKGNAMVFPGGSILVWTIALILLPFVLFGTSIAFWWRRRAA